MLQKFTIESLASVDAGMLKAAFESALRRAQDDCTDRPGVKAARKVVITATLEPEVDDAGDSKTINVKFYVEDKLPKRGGRATNMVAARGGLAWNDESPDDVAQMTFGELGPRDSNGIRSVDREEVANAR